MQNQAPAPLPVPGPTLKISHRAVFLLFLLHIERICFYFFYNLFKNL